MTRHKYTEKQLEWLRYNANTCSIKTLTKRFNNYFGTNLSFDAIYAKCKQIGLLEEKQHTYTEEEIEWLDENITKYKNEVLTEKFNAHFGTNVSSIGIHQKCSRLELRKKMGRYARYAVGAERKDRYGYTYLKISSNKWIPKQKYIYEQHHGKIPKGSIVIFLDKDKNNFDIDNLYLVHRNIFTIASTKKLLTEDAELTKIGLLLAELMCEKAKKEKVKHNELQKEKN